MGKVVSDAAGAYLEVRGVSKRFVQRRSLREALRSPFKRPHVEALRGMSFHVGMGEFFGLLGSNGAGKTTLMKIIATLLRPDAGSVSVGGLDVVRDDARVRERVGIALASERGLYWRLSAWENLRLFAELNAVPQKLMFERMENALQTVGLESARKRMVREFSSGMMQRLLIARALLTEPQLLLLDEPTRSLDPVSAREFRRFLREEIAGRRNCAVLLATHDADEAFNLCNRVAILDHGAIVAQGTAHDLAYDVLGSRHTLVTTAPDHEMFAMLERSHRIEVLDRDGPRVQVRVVGGDENAPGILKDLVQAGVEVFSFGRETATLAELIEGVIARGRVKEGRKA